MTENQDDALHELLGESARVIVWADKHNVKLVEETASHEAVKFVRATAHNEFYIMYFDFSRMQNHAARMQYIQAYLQAMRTAVSRMRAAIKRTNTQRQLREFGIRLKKVDQIVECPGLWRVEVDSTRNDSRKAVGALIDDAVYRALTSETERSLAAPTIVEQMFALNRKGIV